MDEFRAGEATTAFIGKHYGDGFTPSEADPMAVVLAAVLAAEGTGAGWSSNSVQAHPITLSSDGDSIDVRVQRTGNSWSATVQGENVSIAIIARDQVHVRFEADGLTRRAAYLSEADEITIDLDGRVYRFEDTTHRATSKAGAGGDGVLRAPMSGAITVVRVVQEQAVARGDVLAVLEAMKMEHQIVAPISGTVSTVAVAAGQQVGARDILFVLKGDPA